MLRKVATLVGYNKAPKATYVLRHPKKGLAALAAARAARHSSTARRAMTLGAAAVAVPFGYWLFNR